MQQDYYTRFADYYADQASAFDGTHDPRNADVYTEAELNPLLTVWFCPRKTVRSIVAADPKLNVLLLACLAGIARALNQASNQNLGAVLPLPTIFLAAIIIGPLGGLLSLWAGSYLIQISGKWLGGIGRSEHIRTAIAWASVPAVASLMVWAVLIAVFDQGVFTRGDAMFEARPDLAAFMLAALLALMALGLWGLILTCNTIAEVQGFRSAWAGFGNMILAGVLAFVPIVMAGIGIGIVTLAILGGAWQV